MSEQPKPSPLGRCVAEQIWQWRQRRAEKRILASLRATPYALGKQLSQSVERLRKPLPAHEQSWIDAIESERRRLLACTAPLQDGTLGDPIEYDRDCSVSQTCEASKKAKPARWLYELTRATRPRNVIELGTNLGISSAYLGAALEVNGGGGQIVSLDASAYRQRLAREVHQRLGLKSVSTVHGLFTDTLEQVLTELGTVDLAFIDGHHQYQPTLDYFAKILRYSKPETVFVFDDIRWSDGMKQAWSELQADRRLGLVADLSRVGVAVQARDATTPRLVTPPTGTL